MAAPQQLPITLYNNHTGPSCFARAWQIFKTAVDKRGCRACCMLCMVLTPEMVQSPQALCLSEPFHTAYSYSTGIIIILSSTRVVKWKSWCPRKSTCQFHASMPLISFQQPSSPQPTRKAHDRYHHPLPMTVPSIHACTAQLFQSLPAKRVGRSCVHRNVEPSDSSFFSSQPCSRARGKNRLFFVEQRAHSRAL